jgi:AraC-like DNA-binding protein
VVRFDRVVQEVRRGRRARWSSVACEHGYADQAHLCREFQEFAGLSPTEFQRRQGAGLAGVAAS